MGGRGASSSISKLKKSKPTEYKTITNLDINKIEKYKDLLVTDEVILTNERSIHIYDDHPEDYDRIMRGLKNTVSNPTNIYESIKEDGTLYYVRKLRDGNQNAVIKLNIKNDKTHPKNSIISSWIMNEKSLKRFVKKGNMIYTNSDSER